MDWEESVAEKRVVKVGVGLHVYTVWGKDLCMMTEVHWEGITCPSALYFDYIKWNVA